MPYSSLSRELLECSRDVAVLPVPEALAHASFCSPELVRLAS
jgi:hypothetical protein